MNKGKRIPWNKGKKEKIKHYYCNNGITNIRIPCTQEPPEGFVVGRLPRNNYSEESKRRQVEKTKQTKLERYGSETYNNPDKSKSTKLERYGNPNYNNREKASNTCIAKYGVDNPYKIPYVVEANVERLTGGHLSDETKAKISDSRAGTHLSEEMALQKRIKTDITYKEHGLYERHKTKPEIFIENHLKSLFGDEHVHYNYIDKDRYPFKCDFYVDTHDLFIEVHAGWRHNKKPYDPNDEWCKQDLERMKNRLAQHPAYENAIYQWTDLDVKKLNIAIENNLDFVRLYPEEIYFITEKPRELLETLVEMYHPQDNQQPRLPIWE